MLHIYTMCGIFNLPSIDIDTRGHQFNISSEQHPAGILLMKGFENVRFFTQVSNLGLPVQQV